MSFFINEYFPILLLLFVAIALACIILGASYFLSVQDAQFFGLLSIDNTNELIFCFVKDFFPFLLI